jgi:uncharacterized protein YjbI with pentapeptide repeats
MPNPDHLERLRKGVDAWNVWRSKEPLVQPDLRRAELSAAHLFGANLSEADLREAALSLANLSHAKLQGADLRNSNLTQASLFQANLVGAKLKGADLSSAKLGGANLSQADLREARLYGANLVGSDLSQADLRRTCLSAACLIGAKLEGADLSGADLRGAVLYHDPEARKTVSDYEWQDPSVGITSRHYHDPETGRFVVELSGPIRLHHIDQVEVGGVNLRKAKLNGADLSRANLVEADLTDADLTGCRVYGMSAWGLKLNEGTKQQSLIITPPEELEVTCDNIEVAQFIYLLLHNEKIRDVIDTVGKKTVLILGRFTAERKAVLDSLRDSLRNRDYLPVLFDFDKPVSKDLTATVLTLAHMARFIIADLTDPSCIPYEVAKIADVFVPVQPILLSGKSEFAMFSDLQRRFHWVLKTHHYDSPEQLLTNLDERVIRPAEAKVLDLRGLPPT